MSCGITTILFDMDNTLFDLVGAQIAACEAVTRHLGKPEGKFLFENYFLSNRRGFESHENIRDYLLDRGLAVDGNYHEACLIYEDVKLAHIIPYKGVQQTLENLTDEGYNLAIITDAHSRDATRRLEKTRLLPYFTALVAFDMVRVKKPAREPFLTALGLMKAETDNTLLVGDSPRRDIRPARDLGMRTVYASYGDRFSAVRECPEADYIINSIDELLPIIRSLSPEGK